MGRRRSRKERRARRPVDAGTPPARRDPPSSGALNSKSSSRSRNGKPPSNPGAFVVVALLALVVFGSDLAAPYAADPGSVPRPWLYGVAVLAWFTVWGSTVTLTCVFYCLIFLRTVDAARAFLQGISNYTAIGAIAGTLLGLRLADPILLVRQGSPDAPELTFVEFLGLVGSTAMVLTLFAIACYFPWVLGPLRATWKLGLNRTFAAYDELEPSWLRRIRPRGAGVLTFIVILGANWEGHQAAQAVWRMLV
jgi:hypothetical protein